MHVRMCKCHLYRQAALSRAYVAEGVVVFPGELSGDSLSSQHAAGGHRGDEGLESGCIGVERTEMILAFRFGRRIARLQRLCQGSPQAVFAAIVLIEASPEIRRLRLIKIMVAFVSIAVSSFPISREQTHCDKCVEEVTGCAFVHFDPFGQVRGVERAGCKYREHSQLDRAE